MNQTPAPAPAAPPAGPPSATAKLVAVVEALAVTCELKPMERLTGLHPTTLHHILTQLVHEGWVDKIGFGRYALSPGLLRLAGRCGRCSSVPLRAALDPDSALDRRRRAITPPAAHGA